MRRLTSLTVVPALAAVALLGVACSSEDDSSSSTTTSPPTSESSTTTSSTSASSTSTTASGPQACVTANLTAELGPSDAGAGQVYNPLVIRNTGTAACELRGFPGVSVLDASGTQIGQPATRDGNEGGAVLLQPGGAASATLHTANGPIGGPCEAASASMKVFPPGQTAELTFAATYTVCGGFTVTTLVAGDTGTA